MGEVSKAWVHANVSRRRRNDDSSTIPPNRIPKTVGIKTHVTAQHNVHHVRFVYRVKHGSFGMAVNERGGGCVGVYYPDKRIGDQRQFVERDRVVKSRWIGQALIKASPRLQYLNPTGNN